MSETQTLIALKDVSVSRGGRETPELDQFSFAVAPGETVVLLGEHESGKEAVLRILGQAPLREDTIAGTIAYRGNAPERASRFARRALRTAWLPAPFAQVLCPHASAGSQFVRIVARKLAVPRASAHAEFAGALGRLDGAPGAATYEKKPATLSSEELAWGLLAVAVAATPDLLLADRATGDMGPTLARKLTAALLAEQKRLGFALLYAADNVAVARWIGGRGVVMRGGRMIEEGPMERLASPQAHAYTQTLFKSAPKLSAEKPLRTVARGETLLRVQGLDLTGKPEPRRAAREGITFDLRRGASLALVGEEGSGRRSLARAILGLDRPPIGRVVLDAVDLSVLSETMITRLRRRMTFITGGDDALDPRMTLWDTVEEPLRAHLSLPRDMIAGYRENALKRVGLASRDGRTTVGSLPPFEKRRLQIARAIVSTPLLAVVDEPLRGLDAFAQAMMRELLTDFRAQEGPAFLVITSDFGVAQALADEAMVLRDRHVIERGPVHEIIREPRNAYTRGLIDAATAQGPLSLPKESAQV